MGDETIRQFGLAPTTDPLIGSVVGSYRVEAVVGTGAMGIVYRGLHTIIGKPVAIKVLKPDFADDPEMVQRLVREARTVNAIRHPAIVDVFDFGTLPRSGQPYIVMDLLEGEPLDTFIAREAPVPLKVAGPILDQLLAALAAAHAVGVIHRDLKPGNMFLEQQPEGPPKVKVIDFGLARQADRAGGSIRPTNPGTLIGTPAFMAPEQVLGQKLSPATDMYAVGGIAYQLLTAHLPHEAPTAIEVLSQKMAHDPVRPRNWNSDIDAELDAWIMNLLEREPERRLSSADEARKQLRRLVDKRTLDNMPAVKRGTGPQPIPPTVERAPVKPATGERAQLKPGNQTPRPGTGERSLHKPASARPGTGERPSLAEEPPRKSEARGAGVVPSQREWGEAKTLVVDGTGKPKPPDQSTDRHQSPWARGERPVEVDPSLIDTGRDGVPAPPNRGWEQSPTLIAPPNPSPPGDMRRTLPVVPLELDAVAQELKKLEAQKSEPKVDDLTLPPKGFVANVNTLPPKGLVADTLPPVEDTLPPGTVGAPKALYVALIVSVLALIGGLVWFFSQK